MKRVESLWVPYSLATIGYCVYAAFTESGPVGWINIVQQSIFGAYWTKGSVLAALLLMMLAGALVFAGLEKLSGAGTAAPTSTPTPPQVTRPATPPMSHQRMLFMVYAGMPAATWIIGLSVCGWLTHRQQADNTATYRPLTLAAGEPPVVRPGDHLALRAEVLAGHILAQTSSEGGVRPGDTRFVPLVAPGWRTGQPVHFVVGGPPPREWTGFDRAPGSQRGSVLLTLLVRVEGAVPVMPAHEFGKLGVPLAPSNHLLTLVPAQDGKPLQQHADYLEITLWSCAALSVLLIFFGAVSSWAARRQRRRAR